MANQYGKTRKADNPYFTVERDGWTWRILKLYKAPAASLHDQYARAFCHVSSPYLPAGELGDVYVREIPGIATILGAS
jgi:hypothetical protein